MQGRFKTLPKGRLFCGAMLQESDWPSVPGMGMRTAVGAGKRLLAKVIGEGSYVTLGARGAAATQPNAELAHAVHDFRAFDQLIVTPAGETPPPIEHDLDSCGCQRRHMSKAEWGAYVDAATSASSLCTTKTYTFAFWGMARFANLVDWKYLFLPFGVGIPMEPSYPTHCVLYALEDGVDDGAGGGGGAHLESGKQYLVDLLFFSTRALPLAESVLDQYQGFRDAHGKLNSRSAEFCRDTVVP